MAIAADGFPSATNDDGEWERILRALDPNGRVVAYVFRCLHCGALGGYWDCD
jgi:uncharacterized protein CbrC (UPF0167 family)